jgi:hypothetical protein
VSASSLVKTARLFKETKLGKDKDPKTWIKNIEDLGLKLEVMGFNLTENKFSSDFEL